MNTNGIHLPTRGVMGARFIDGMRECWDYDVNQDIIVARYDTVIDGAQRVVWAKPFWYLGVGGTESAKDERGRTADEWLAEQRAIAKGIFEADERASQKNSAVVRRLTTVSNG